MLAVALLAAYWSILIAALAYIIRCGGRPERIGALIMVFGSVLSALVITGVETRFHAIEPGLLAVDIVVLIALIGVMLRSNRFWPIWATSFHCIGLLSHVAVVVTPDSLAAGYAIMQGFWAYPMLLAIFLGAYGHQKAKSTSP